MPVTGHRSDGPGITGPRAYGQGHVGRTGAADVRGPTRVARDRVA